MKKKKQPTVSQYAYVSCHILSAFISRGEIIDDEAINKSVSIATKVVDKIHEIVGQNTEDDDDEEDPKDEAVIDYFADYPWNGEQVRYTELANWLRDVQLIRSNYRISKIFKEAYAAGYIIKDPKTGKFSHHSTP